MSRSRISFIALLMLSSLRLALADDRSASQPAKVDPVDFRKLKELMPAEAAGVKRSNNEGEKVSIANFVLSKANAEYSKSDAGENAPRVTIEIVDYGGAPEMGMAAGAWSGMQIDKESDAGYEKTTKIKDQPAYEQYQKEGKSGELHVIVGGRFLLNIQTANLASEELKKIGESLPIDKILILKDQAKPK